MYVSHNNFKKPWEPALVQNWRKTAYGRQQMAEPQRHPPINARTWFDVFSLQAIAAHRLFFRVGDAPQQLFWFWKSSH